MMRWRSTCGVLVSIHAAQRAVTRPGNITTIQQKCRPLNSCPTGTNRATRQSCQSPGSGAKAHAVRLMTRVIQQLREKDISLSTYAMRSPYVKCPKIAAICGIKSVLHADRSTPDHLRTSGSRNSLNYAFRRDTALIFKHFETFLGTLCT